MNILKVMSRHSLGLGLFAIVTAGVIAVTLLITRDKIDENIQRAAMKTLQEVMPEQYYTNDLQADSLKLSLDNTQLTDLSLLGPIAKDAKAYIARRDNQVSGIILPVVAPNGYTTKIDLVIGIDSTASILGARVIAHKETPGLGDKIDIKKSDWILTFNGKSLTVPAIEAWAVKKDGGEFDQLTGATITPRAIVQAIKNALTFFEKNQHYFLQAPSVNTIANTHPPQTQVK